MSILYSQSFAAGTSTFCNPGHVSLNGSDPLYPEFRQAETIKVTAGAGPSGENVIETDLAGPPNPYAVSGIDAYNQSWPLPFFNIVVKVKPLPAALAESGNYAVIFKLTHNVQNEVFGLYYDCATQQLELSEDDSVIATLPLSAASISNVWQTFRFCGKASTDNGFGAQDATLSVYRNGVEIFNQTGLFLVMGGTTSPIASGYKVGYFGMLGQVTGLSIQDTACGVVVTDESDVCSCTGLDPDTADAGGGTGAGASPIQYPSIGQSLVCAGGGTVPTQSDLVHSETWWSS